MKALSHLVLNIHKCVREYEVNQQSEREVVFQGDIVFRIRWGLTIQDFICEKRFLNQILDLARTT